MKKIFLNLLFLTMVLFSFGQVKTTKIPNQSIIANDTLINDYVKEYIAEANKRGFCVADELFSKVNYILIVPEDFKVNNLAETNLDVKIITLDSKVLLDRLILKVNLYRELSYTLGVPYDKGSVIMYRQKDYGFSYAAFDDIDIMNIELSTIMDKL